MPRACQKILLIVALALGIFSTSVPAAVIGTNIPATSLTLERVIQSPAWKSYVKKSMRQRQADQDFLHRELKAHGLAKPSLPPFSGEPRGTPLGRPAEWYAQAEARRIADCVISYQTPAGGWSKHTDFTQQVRASGEAFAVDNSSKYLLTNDFDIPTEVNWNYIGTFDNDATYTELHFLAKVITANPKATNGAAWRAAFLRGIDYIMAAQFPNGGWPQVWPLQGGYHDEITYNDDAMLNVIETMRAVAEGREEFAFVPQKLRKQAAASYRRGVDCLLATQVIDHGQRTVWCQQYDALTLQPGSARNYEMPALCSSESADITLFLMELPDADSNEVAAVRGAVAWFKKTEIMDRAYRSVGTEGRQLVTEPGNGPLWSRYYEIGTDKPIFGDRDLSIHDDVNELSLERRRGYGWYRDTPKRVVEHYSLWSKEHPEN
jgi:PelA/Pel-15E family pectate lyase